MLQNIEGNLAVVLNKNHLADLLDVLDSLHTAASDGDIERLTGMNQRELVGLLREFIYTAEETLEELDHTAEKNPRPVLRILDKPA